MRKRYLDSEDRKEQRLRALQTRNPACVICGESDSACLERHHIAGRKHHDDVSIVCRNCHRKLTDRQLDHVLPMATEPSGELATIGNYLLGLCDLLAMIVETLRQFGKSLVNKSER